MSANMTGRDRSPNFLPSKSADRAQRQILSCLSTQRNPFPFYFRMVTCILTGSSAWGAVRHFLGVRWPLPSSWLMWCSFLKIKFVCFWPKGALGVFNISVCVVPTDAQLKDRTRPFGAAAAYWFLQSYEFNKNCLCFVIFLRCFVFILHFYLYF